MHGPIDIKFITQNVLMATCFDSIESSSGLPENRSNVSKCTANFDTLDLFFGMSDDDSIESKHVAMRTFYVINCYV
jgi:hypothetical protein